MPAFDAASGFALPYLWSLQIEVVAIAMRGATLCFDKVQVANVDKAQNLRSIVHESHP